MRIYETIRAAGPDFFIHSGDLIYADNPLQEEVVLDDGSVWRNRVTPSKRKVAETLEEFRGNFRYNLLDENLCRFHAEVPLIVQWDDHETTNNWYPDEQLLEDARYTVKSAALLAARGRRALFEYTPIRVQPDDPERIYRRIARGPQLDVFVIDQRSYRGVNTPNRQEEQSADTAFLGGAQLSWLQRELAASRATWKIVASDMPIGLVVPDGEVDFEGLANGDDGPPRGRELEMAELLSFLKKSGVRNVVWLTADVHYAASHYYDPDQAAFRDFDGFWEFVSGPLHAGTFGPNPVDGTFGLQVRFLGIPEGMRPNRSPAEGHQFFGFCTLDGATGMLRVEHRNAGGETLWRVELEPK